MSIRQWTALIVAISGAFGVSKAVAAPSLPTVTWQDERISVHANGSDVGTLLQEIARATGAQLRGVVPVGPALAADCERVALPEALTRLLGQSGFTIRYGRGTEVSTIVLVEEGTASPSPLVSDQRSPGAGIDPPPILAALDLPISARGRLRRRLGASPTFGLVINALLTSTDPADRLAAFRDIARSAAHTDAVATFVADALVGADDRLLGELFGGVSRTKVTVLAGRVARGTRLQDIEARFLDLRQRLRGDRTVH